MDFAQDRWIGGSKDPLNDLVIPHSRPRPLATPLDRTHTTQARRRVDGRTEDCTMAGPDQRGRRREGIGEGGSRREGGTEPLNSQLLRSATAKACLSVRPRLAEAAEEGSEITTEEGASGDVPDQRKDHSPTGEEGRGEEGGRHEWKGDSSFLKTVITLKTSPQDLIRGRILK